MNSIFDSSNGIVNLSLNFVNNGCFKNLIVSCTNFPDCGTSKIINENISLSFQGFILNWICISIIIANIEII